MSSQPPDSKRKRNSGPTLGNFLHPGEWRSKRARSGSPPASGACTPGGAYSNNPAPSNPSPRSPSPMGHPEPSSPSHSSLNTSSCTPVLPNATLQSSHPTTGASIAIEPADEDITELAEHAGNLFIYTATAIRYIRPPGKAVNSKARLKAILAVSIESKSTLSAIDALYTATLTAAINDQELRPEEKHQMRLVLWTAICACEPILTHTLCALSGLENKDDTIAALQPLRSVLHVSEHSELVTTLHASFPDYMLTWERSGTFYCDQASHSQLLAEQCFRAMKAQLRFGICLIQSSFIPNHEIPDIEERIATSIS
ncbi:hypothetical protein RSAG8_11742, partial [Rhizoctonia solani AG-8 WAC10335]